jgi:rhamnosyltransferase
MTTLLSNDLPRVAVLLASRNGREWLPAQIDGILNQSGVAVHLVVSDDASTDETWAWLRGTFAGHADVVLVRHERPSGSAGANFRNLFVGADVGDADYVALADQDDLWALDKLRRAVDCLASEGSAGYSSSVEAFWPDDRRRVLRQNPHERAADFLFEGAGQGCTFVVTRPLFDDVRAFCTRHQEAVQALHYHDWLIYILARAGGHRWVFDPVSSIRYRQHHSNEIGARRGRNAIQRRMALIINGWYRHQVVAACRIYLLADGDQPVALALAHRFLAHTAGPVRKGAIDRVRLATVLVTNGRRFWLDRGVLALAVLAGWL